jgi:malonyl-CoA O-methyltransferase
MSQLAKIQQSFQRSLVTYDQHAYVQKNIAESLQGFLLSELSKQNDSLQFEHVLEIGCGTGFFSKQLVECIDAKCWTFNDLVGDCECVLSDYLSSSKGKKNWRFLAGDIESIVLPEGLDLVCSASTLQWVRDTPELLNRLPEKMIAKSWLALSSFGPNHFLELRNIQNQLDQDFMSLNYLNEDEWRRQLTEHYDIKLIKTQLQVEWFNTVEDVLKHLRKTGVNGNARQQWSQSRMKEFQATYEKEYAKDGKIPLSYEPVYVIARLRDRKT